MPTAFRCRLPLLLPALLLLAACTPRLNRLDHAGNRTGRWALDYDSAGTRPLLRERFRHGRPVGYARHYSYTGQLERQEHYRRHGFSTITYYHPNGRVARRGQARLVAEPDGQHFYWFGEWPAYDEAGRLLKVDTYTGGKLTATRPGP